MSIALHLFTAVYYLYTTPVVATALQAVNNNSTLGLVDDVIAPETMLSTGWFITATAVLGFYIFSIVFGRLYTGMHSFTDCIVGVLLGAGIWALHFVCGSTIDAWIVQSGWIGMFHVLCLDERLHVG